MNSLNAKNYILTPLYVNVTSIFGILLAALSAFLKSSSELLSKHSFNIELNEFVLAWSLRFFAIPFISIILYFRGIPSISPNFWIALSVGGSISIIASVMYMKALKYSDVSIVSPIGALTPLLLLFTSPLIVNEFPDTFGFIGVLIITFGVYTMNIDTAKVGYFQPIKAIWNEKGARYMFVLVILYSISSNFDKIGIEASSPVFYTFSLHVVAATGLSVLMVYYADDWRGEIRNNWKKVLPVGALSGLSSVIQMVALTYTLVIYVITVKRIGIIFSVLGGHFLFDEEDIKERLAGTVIIVIGLIIISLSLA